MEACNPSEIRELDVSGRGGRALGWDSFHVIFWIPRVFAEKLIFVCKGVRKALPEPPHPPLPQPHLTSPQVIDVFIFAYDFEHVI